MLFVHFKQQLYYLCIVIKIRSKLVLICLLCKKKLASINKTLKKNLAKSTFVLDLTFSKYEWLVYDQPLQNKIYKYMQFRFALQLMEFTLLKLKLSIKKENQ